MGGHDELAKREPIDTPNGRLWLEEEAAILYSRGQNLHDGRAAEHTDDGFSGDIVIWPPIRATEREQELDQGEAALAPPAAGGPAPSGSA